MMNRKRNLLNILATLVLLFSLHNSTHAQAAYESALEKIDAQHQDCLDNAEDTKGCSAGYYKAIDSLMNIAYREALKALPTTEKAGLRNEQRDWLLGRNTKFAEIDADAKKNSDGAADRNVAVEEKAAFLRDRLEELIGKGK